MRGFGEVLGQALKARAITRTRVKADKVDEEAAVRLHSGAEVRYLCLESEERH